MQISSLLVLVLGLTFFSYFFGRKKALGVARSVGGVRKMHSLPGHYGYLVALWCALPAIALITLWALLQPILVEQAVFASLPESVRSNGEESLKLFSNDIRNIAKSHSVESVSDPIKRSSALHYMKLNEISRWSLSILTLVLFTAGGWFALKHVQPSTPARVRVETAVRYFLIICASIAIMTTIGIVLSVLFESIRFFREVNFWDFVTGLKWSPQTAIRSDQVGSSGSFGAVPLFTGTLLISAIALIVAVPLGLMSAIYLAEYASACALLSNLYWKFSLEFQL